MYLQERTGEGMKGVRGKGTGKGKGREGRGEGEGSEERQGIITHSKSHHKMLCLFSDEGEAACLDTISH
jgi:hypothetical protein